MKRATRATKVAYVKAQTQSRNHTCHWPGCERQVKPAFWGCAPHWYKLPRQLRDLIWQNYEPGQEINMNPSEGYLSASQVVQKWIRDYEAGTLTEE